MTPEYLEWKKGIREHLSKMGINVAENAIVEPPRKKSYSFDRTPINRNPVIGPKKEIPRVAASKQEAPAPKVVEEKAPLDTELIRESNGTFKIPTSWKLSGKSKEIKQKVASAMHGLKRAIEIMEKNDPKKYGRLILSHKEVLRDLLTCLN
jgi:hypothetical protein